jgi:arsenate reductase-like glutaredoxin family protein
MSPGEFSSIVQAVGGIHNLIDCDSKNYADIAYLTEEDIPEKLMTDPRLIKTPVVRDGRKACCGYQPEYWKEFCSTTAK